MYSRRDFGKLAVTGLPLASTAWGAKINSTVKGVRLGIMSISFRDFKRTPGKDNVDDIVKGLVECGAGDAELFSPNVEPWNPARLPQANATPEEAAKAREELRQWRLNTPISFFKDIGKKFDAAGINLHTYTVNFRADFTDEEIDKCFQHAKAMGVNILSTATMFSITPKLLTFAEKHKMYLAFHPRGLPGEADEFTTPETYQKALDMSKWAKLNVDVAYFVSMNYDPIPFLEKHHARMSHIHMRDSKRNRGGNAEWGKGDTPIKEVLALLRDKKYQFPVIMEYEYPGTGTSIEEIKKCMAYMRSALA